MKILHVVRRLDATLGGAPAAAAHLAGSLSAEGHDVTIATTVPVNGSRHEIEQLVTAMGEGVRVQCFPRNSLPYDHSPPLGQWLQRSMEGFDLVEAHGVFDYPSWRAAETAHRSRRPLLIHAHGSLDPFDLRKHPKVKSVVGPTVIRRSLNHATAIMVTSDREGAALRRFGSRTKVRSIPLPYRPNECRGDADRFRRRYDIPAGPVVLFIGRLDYKKGLQHLVDAAQDLKQRGVGVTFVLAGSTSSAYAQALRDDVEVRGLGSVVLFPGHLGEDEKADSLAAATVFALVSDNENYGLVLVEAARAGLPLLLSDQVYLEQELRASGAALVVARDGSAVAGALHPLLADPLRIQRMSAAALRASHDLFDWKVVARAQSDFRVQILGDRRQVA